jgi:RNA polymerase sigma factor (sigma-70 family)
MNILARAANSTFAWDPDEILVRRCLEGNENAWSVLIDKYKNLIFSIPVKYDIPPDDASEIFQSVCLSLLRELPRLREPKALPAWLIRLTAHKCTRWKHERQRFVHADVLEEVAFTGVEELPDQLLLEVETEQLVREAMNELPADCRRLLDLLFLTEPPLRYDDAAATLGLATGSIGATRMRCLQKLRRSLMSKGLQPKANG